MKIKGISLFEQHVEKLVVAVVAVIVLAALALQFLSESNVTVGGQEVPLARAFESVERDAERVTSAIRDSDPSLPEPPEVSIGDAFEAHMAARRGERPDVLALGPAFRVDLGGDGPGPGDGDEPFAAFDPPAPSAPVAGRYRGAIDPRDVIDIPGLSAFVPAQQPFDAAAITIAARFDGVELQNRLDSPPAGERAAPRSWTTEIEILGVQAERQRRLSDGSWSDAEPVASAPTMTDLLARVRATDFRAADMPPVLDIARAGRRMIVQPPFYRTLFSAPWNPPTLATAFDAGADEGATGEEAREIERLTRQLRATERQTADLEQRLERLRNQPTPDRTPPPGNNDRRRDPPPSRDDAPDNQPQSAEERLQAELATLEARAQETRDRLRALGVVFEDDESDGATEGYDPERLGPLGPVLSNPSLSIWTHDLSAEPGVDYRYRIRPVFNNPYFGQTLPPEQAEMAASPTAAGEWSPWTEPVRLLNDAYYFVTTASEAGVGPARSTFELYRFYYGDWRVDSVGVEPGDALTARIEVPVLPIFDLDALRVDDPGDARRDRDAGRDADRDREFEGDRGRDDRRDGRFGPDGDRRDRAEPRPRPREAEGPRVASEEGPSALPFDVGAVLLDVAPDLAAGDRPGAAVQVYLYQDGRIETRRPAEDTASELYRALRDAAREALNRASEPSGRL